MSRQEAPRGVTRDRSLLKGECRVKRLLRPGKIEVKGEGMGAGHPRISCARVFLDIQVKTPLYSHLKKGDLIGCAAPDVVYLAIGVGES
jgi:hypothetical protein